MKFTFLVVSALLLSICASSQYQVGFFAGPQATTAHYTVMDIKQSTSMKFGFQAGMGFKVPFENKLSFAPSIFYSMKGYKVTFTQHLFPPDPAAADNDTRIHCVEVAALLQYDFSDQPGHWFLKIGPSLDFQLFGHEKYNLMGGGTVSKKMKFGFAEYGHYSANMLVHLGYEAAGGLVIFAQYGYGLASINNADGGPRIHHRVYGISVGKYFHRGKIVMNTKTRE